ncbi:GNAT family N-acetyltransferase [Arenimonas aestuarii]
MQASLRAATEADLPFLLALRQESMGPHLATAGLHGTADDFMARVMHCFECAQIVQVGGKPVGLLKLQRGSAEWRLLQLQLSADVRGQGLGRSLLEAILDEAARAGTPVTLSVLKANPARRLYESLGFAVVSEDADEWHMARP